jgi:ABC-2 type transport system permease protein
MESVVLDRGRGGWRWRGVARKYSAVLRIGIANNLAYGVEVFLRALFLIVLVFIISQLWKATFAARNTQAYSGFTLNTLIWYLLAAETFALSLPDLRGRIDREVRSGQLAYLLGRPCNYILYNFSLYLGERLVRMLMNASAAIVLGLLIVGPPQLNWWGLLAWPLTVVLALSIEFCVYFCIGLLAFWTEETYAFAFIYSRMVLVLGGVIAPLEVFPEPLRGIARALPFSVILYGPARTLAQFSGTEFVGLLWQQSLTLLGGMLLVGLLYRVALRRVSINGG